MLNLSNLKPKIRKQVRKRVGRGTSSGHGAYSGRGIKGQKARTGGGIRPGFEGGRMPIIRQMPKVRGFKSIHSKAQVVNLLDIESRFDQNEIISPQALLAKNLIRNAADAVKILGKADIKKKLDFKDVKLSKAAAASVQKAGGKILEK